MKTKTANRQISGRLEEWRWQRYKDAAKEEGLTLTSWTIKYLDRAAAQTLDKNEH